MNFGRKKNIVGEKRTSPYPLVFRVLLKNAIFQTNVSNMRAFEGSHIPLFFDFCL
jgi:hypothetical protein